VGALSNVRPLPLLAACAAVLLLSTCGSGEDADTGAIAVSDAWALATVNGQPNGAVYFTITSATDDTLERASVPETVADHTEFHEAVITATGATGMREITSGVALDPGTAVTFTPGGMHLMLVDLAEPLVEGRTFDITLAFARADQITLPVVVVERAP
jgi:copper(I)-binding protein